MRPSSARRAPALFFALAALEACATAGGARPTTPPTASAAPRAVAGGSFAVVGRPDGSGDAYDAQMLLDRGNAAVDAHRCEDALPFYERLGREFASSELVPAAEFNRGLCLQSLGRPAEAAEPYRAAARRARTATFARDAWFRLAVVAESARQPTAVLEATEALLAVPGLSIVDRVEALARRSAAQLALEDRPAASRTATEAIALAPTAEAVSALQDDTYIAQARFIAAEVYRLDGAAVRIVVEDADLERNIERRVQLVTHAHTLFNDAIRVGNPHWAAACGYSIGEMYRALYDSIVHAPVPADWDEAAAAIYRRRTGERLRPLLTGALRAWEATLSMANRNGIGDNTWVARTQEQLTALRELVLQSNASEPDRGAATPRSQRAANEGAARR